jgi:hypothetical protein
MVATFYAEHNAYYLPNAANSERRIYDKRWFQCSLQRSGHQSLNMKSLAPRGWAYSDTEPAKLYA